jgi:hypothetical protein
MKMKILINNMKFGIMVLCLIFIMSCSKDESVTSKIQSEVSAGGILRTIKVNQSTFNFFDTNSKWSVTVEEQDATNGSIFSEIKVYATQITGGVTKPEKFVKSVPASNFAIGPNGYPRGDVSATLAETLTALGITTGAYTPSDKISMRLQLVLTDGRTFSTKDVSPTISGGSYFSSPFQYSVQFFCPLANVADFNGTYLVTADVWQDYVPGKDTVPVVYNPADGLYTFRIMNTNNPAVINSGTSYIIVKVNPVDASVTVTSNEKWDYGGGFVTTVTGTGSVGSCTGDINLKLNFSGSSQNQILSLVKKL